MKIEITQTFYGRPNDADVDTTMFLEGAQVDVPDAFGSMVIYKGLAKETSEKKSKETPNEDQ